MTYTTGSIFQTLKLQYQLHFLTDFSYSSHPVDAVRIVEHADTLLHVRANELIITTGIMLTDEGALLSFCKELISHNASGLIINIGPYIQEPSPALLKLCNKKLPLLSLPWELETVELERSIYELLMSRDNTDTLSTLFMQYLNQEKLRPVLWDTLLQKGIGQDQKYDLYFFSFHKDSYLKNYANCLTISEKIHSHYILASIDSITLFFFYDCDAYERKSLLREFSKLIYASDHEISLFTGPTDMSLSLLGISFSKLLSFSSVTLQVPGTISSYQDMDIYDLLLSCNASDSLSDIYYKYYEKLHTYDMTQKTNYCKLILTLFECNFSRTRLSEKMFLHRNTIQYQLGKIEDILNCNLSDPHDITCIYLSFTAARFFSGQTRNILIHNHLDD